MKLFVITLIVMFQWQTSWSQEGTVIVAEKVNVTGKADPKSIDQAGKDIESTDKVTKPQSSEEAKKSGKIDDFSLPSLNLFPLLDPNQTNKLPPLPVGSYGPPKKKYVNGRYVISRVARASDKKPEMEMRKIRGKWVICLKD